MHVLTTAVGERTEHWTSLFRAISKKPDIKLSLFVSDVTDATCDALTALESEQPESFTWRSLPRAFSEGATGHMASVVFGRGSGQAFRAERPDVVHVIGEASYLSTWQVRKFRNRYWPSVPMTLYAAQNVVMKFPPPFPAIERGTYGEVTEAFPITPAALSVLRKKGYAGPASLIPLGVDTTHFKPLRESHRQSDSADFTVGFVGRLETHKGVADLLTAVQLVGCRAIFVGDGSLKADIEAAAAASSGRIQLLGWTDHADLPSIMDRFDCLVLPSIEIVQRNLLPWIGIPLREQFGRVLVEAMACGVPVIGSDVGEIPYVIGDAGLTYKAGDASALMSAIRSLRDDAALLNKCAARGLARATREFAWDHVADLMVDRWRQLSDMPDPADLHIDLAEGSQTDDRAMHDLRSLHVGSEVADV